MDKCGQVGRWGFESATNFNMQVIAKPFASNSATMHPASTFCDKQALIKHAWDTKKWKEKKKANRSIYLSICAFPIYEEIWRTFNNKKEEKSSDLKIEMICAFSSNSHRKKNENLYIYIYNIWRTFNNNNKNVPLEERFFISIDLKRRWDFSLSNATHSHFLTPIFPQL